MALLTLVTLAPAAGAAPARRSAELLPATTRAYLSIADSEALQDRWSRTQLAELADAPALQAFRAQVQRQIDRKQAQMEQLYGVNLDELLAVSIGEAAMAVVETPGDQVTRVFLIQVGDDLSAVHDLLSKVETRLVQRLARKSQLALAGVQVAHYQVPQSNASDEDVLYFVHDGVLGLGGDVATITQLLEQWNEATVGKLASLPAFADVMQRVGVEDPAWNPPVVFFAHPLRLDELLDPTEIQADGKRRPTFAAKHGFNAIQGIGGGLSLAENGLDVLYRLAVYAPPPHAQGMQILDFPASDDFTPPDWAPEYLNSLTTLYWRVEKILDHIGPLFDDVAANDDLGAFDDIYQDVKNDLNVDLKELAARLGPRLVVTSDALEKTSNTSQRDLVAIQIKPGQETRVAEDIERLLRDDPTVKRLTFPISRRDGARTVVERHTLWRVGEAGGLGRREDRKGFTAAGILVTRGYLLIATNYEMLRRLFAPAVQLEGAKFAGSKDFQDAMQRLTALSGESACARIFAHADRDFFTTYELLRQGQLEEAETMYGRAITKLLEQLDEGQTLDFDTLPPFGEIVHYFGKSATAVKPQPTGWLVVGFVKP